MRFHKFLKGPAKYGVKGSQSESKGVPKGSQKEVKGNQRESKRVEKWKPKRYNDQREEPLRTRIEQVMKMLDSRDAFWIKFQ